MVKGFGIQKLRNILSFAVVPLVICCAANRCMHAASAAYLKKVKDNCLCKEMLRSNRLVANYSEQPLTFTHAHQLVRFWKVEEGKYLTHV